jgi:hypothetical protein
MSTRKERHMAKEKHLGELFHDTLKDIYFAEKKILTALPKMAKAAQSDDLRAAFEKHTGETEQQVTRLEQVFKAIGETPKGKTCDAIMGIRRAGGRALRDLALWHPEMLGRRAWLRRGRHAAGRDAAGREEHRRDPDEARRKRSQYPRATGGSRVGTHAVDTGSGAGSGRHRGRGQATPANVCCLRGAERASSRSSSNPGVTLVRFRNASIRSLSLVASVACAAAAAQALELTGQAGVLGEWELTATVAATGGKREFAGPVTLKHTGICTTDEPETRTGEIRLQLASASRVKATLTIDGNPCTYSATKSDAYVGTMSCRDRRDVPLRLWVK